MDERLGVLVQKTRHSQMALACAAANRVETRNPGGVSVFPGIDGDLVKTEYRFDAQAGEKITLDKFICYTTTIDLAEQELRAAASAEVLQAAQAGYEKLRLDQAAFLAKFWHNSDIEIGGDVSLQQGIRFNIFHLLQSTGRDGRTNIAAKGLTGEGYEGHYFWDTETFVLPFFLYNTPEISRKLLEYRYNTIDRARERARQMSHNRGALFPWRTINGDECSAYYPAGTAQYHIDADIAFAVKRYVEATGDDDFLVTCGAEILFETARLWADLGRFIPARGDKFCINGVTGPDEYNAVVNNNCYTNLMAKVNLEYANRIAGWMKGSHPGQYEALKKKIGLAEEEVLFWKKAADSMYVPYDTGLGIHLQDDAFLDRAPWDFENTPRQNYPLLLHYHPLVIYRHRVCKQADLVLALFLLGDLFTAEEKKRNYDFYEPYTTHDSSLSTSIFSVMASETGYPDKVYAYFMNTARMDLDDRHGNTKDGIHAANMAGAWMCLVNGFAGMRTHEHTLSFNPTLPQGWQSYSFKILFRGSRIQVTVTGQGAQYRLLEGEALTLLHSGKEVRVSEPGF